MISATRNDSKKQASSAPLVFQEIFLKKFGFEEKRLSKFHFFIKDSTEIYGKRFLGQNFFIS